MYLSKKHFTIFVSLSLILLCVIMVISYSVTKYFSSSSLSNETIRSTQTQNESDVYFIQNNSLYSSAIDKKPTLLIPYSEQFVDQIQQISPLGNYIVIIDPESHSHVYDSNGKKLVFEKNFIPYVWSPDEKYAIGITPALPITIFELFNHIHNYELWDFQQMEKVSVFNEKIMSNSIIGITNDKKIIYYTSIPNKNRTESANIEMFIHDIVTNEKQSIGKYYFDSNHTELISPDSTQLAFGHLGNLHTYNFKLNTVTKHTHNQPNDAFFGNIHWSPDGKKIAFHFSDWFSEDHSQRIGILDTNTNTIQYIEKEVSDGFLPTDGVERLIYFYPTGWSKDGKSLAVFLEGTTGFEDNDSYWKYDFATKKYSRLDFLDLIDYPKFIY